MTVTQQVRSGSTFRWGWLLGPVIGVAGFLAMVVFGQVGFSVTDDIPVE